MGESGDAVLRDRHRGDRHRSGDEALGALPYALGRNLGHLAGRASLYVLSQQRSGRKTFQGYGRYFIIPAVLFVLYMAYARKQGQLKNGMAEAGAALLVGGAIGNAIDRAVFGWVTDFVDNGRGILNLADIAIQVGVLLLLADAVRDFIVSRRGRKSNPLT